MSQVRTLSAAQLRQLDERARTDPRLRANLNLHDGDSALLHRFVICMHKGSYVRPHRHNAPHKLEMATMLEGAMEWIFFDDSGRITHRVRVQPHSDTLAVEVPPFIWHSVLPLTGSAAFLEVKQGPYDAQSDKEFASWAPAEGSAGSAAYLDWLYRARPGERFSP